MRHHPIRKISALGAPALLALCTSAALADNVTLKNGDQLSGTITQVDAATVKLTSPVLGTLSIPRDAVKTMHSDAQVNIVTPAGDAHTAFVGPSADAATWTESTTLIPAKPPGPPPAPAPLDLERYWLPIGPHWKNQLVLGVLNSTGNTQSTNVTGNVALNYKDAPHELNIKFGGAYGQTNGSRDAELAFFDAVYRRDLPEWSDRWFTFAETHELYDGLKAISFRTIDSVGLGYYLFKGDKFNLDLRAGPGFTYVKHFSESDSTDFTGMAGLRAEYKFNDRLSASEDLLYSNGLTHTDRYQIVSETALNLKLPELMKGLGLKFFFDDDYDSTAGPGIKPNDTRTGLALTLDF